MAERSSERVNIGKNETDVCAYIYRFTSWTLSLSSNTPFEDSTEDLALISRIERNLFRLHARFLSRSTLQESSRCAAHMKLECWAKKILKYTPLRYKISRISKEFLMFANRIYLVVLISDYPLRALSILSSKVGRNVFYSRENKKTTTNIIFFFFFFYRRKIRRDKKRE